MSDDGAAVEPELRVTCACGQSWFGPESVVIAQVQQHGIDVHNMRVTPDQVRAMATVDPTSTQS